MYRLQEDKESRPPNHIVLFGTIITLAVICIALVITLVLLLSSRSTDKCEAASFPSYFQGNFSLWDTNSTALDTLIRYVKDVTNAASSNYIPPVDRIAVFDFDGTLFGEKHPVYIEWYMFVYRALKDPTYTATVDMKALAQQIVQAIQTNSLTSELEKLHAQYHAKAFAGLNTEEFASYVRSYLQLPAPGFTGLTIGGAYYLPMMQVVEYLNSNDFKTYIVSGTDRYMIRETLGTTLPILPERVIGSEYSVKATNQGDTPGMSYMFTTTDSIIRTDDQPMKDIHMNKVDRISHEIGRSPVLAFGNAKSDFSMCVYATAHNKYRSNAFILIADDVEREYGNIAKAAETKKAVEEAGWTPVSMKNDFLTIYGDNVKKDPESIKNL